MVLTVTEDTPADMLTGSMELLVQLPRDHHVHSQRVTVERSTAMMDLLVQIATAHKLAASSYTLQAIGERGVVLPHQPNTPIGALDALQVKLLPKQGTFIPRKAKQPNQPFETTFRLQVHLPRNQLYVSRVSPKMNLGEILEEVCREKNLDRNKYELRHPGNHKEVLNPSLSLQDYHLQEVTLYAKQGESQALSTQDIMALQRQEDRRRQQAKQSIFGFMFRKSKESSLSTDSLGDRSVSPAHSDETGRSVSPLAPPTRPQRKRRPAPNPPVMNKTTNKEEKLVISHSRNSSDSSGYHEASVLSDNPDSAARMPETLPRRSKPPGKFETRKLAHTSQASKSLSNLAVTASLSHATSNTSLSSNGIRKKRAAPPPPMNRPLSSAISTQALERIVDSEESLTSDMGISKPPSDVGSNSKANSDIAVEIHTPEDFYDKREIRSKKVIAEEEERIAEVSENRKSPEHIVEPARVAKRDKQEVPSDTDILLQKVSTTLAAVLPSPDPQEVPSTPKKPPEVEKIEPETANQTLNSQQDTSDYVSATGEDLSGTDWEYQLPDPPSAFRDSQSPDPYGYETITLSSVEAFKEPIAIIDTPKPSQTLPEASKTSPGPPKPSQVLPEASKTSPKPPEPSKLKKPQENQEKSIKDAPKPQKITEKSRKIPLNSQLSQENRPSDLKKHIISELETKIETGALIPHKIPEESKKIVNKSSPRIAPVDNTLSNFTITTYSNQKPPNIYDNDRIFPEASDDRIVKTFATLARNRSTVKESPQKAPKIGSEVLKRTQSTQDVESEVEDLKIDVDLRPQNDNKSSVHRSKSYIVLSNNSKYREDKKPQIDVPDSRMYKSTSYTNLNQETDELQSVQVLKTILPQINKQISPEIVKKPEESKRYKWAGPPAINLGSWSERPSVNVQIKHDSDYKFGAKSNKNGKTVVNLNSTSNDVEIIKYESSKTPKKSFFESNERTNANKFGFSNGKIEEDKSVDDVKIDTRPVSFKELTQAFGQVNLRSRSTRNQLNRHSDFLDYRQGTKEDIRSVGEWPKVKRYTSVVGINPDEGKMNKVNGFVPIVKGFKSEINSGESVGRFKVPTPPTMPIITGVTLKNSRQVKSAVKEPRDQLLESIRNFGRDKLKRSVSTIS